jgi:hypothetical protein
LLGPSLGRRLFTVDPDASTDDLVRTMRDAHVRYAYVPASPSSLDRVTAKYSPALFEVVHVSEVTSGDRAGTRRYLYRLREQVASR